jgi:hydrogenase expression/formation protein HypC
MCLGIPGQIVELLGDHLAKVDVAGVRRNVNVGLVEAEVVVGDWVLIHVGFAMSRVDEEEAEATLDFLQTLGQIYDDELRAVAESSIE